MARKNKKGARAYSGKVSVMITLKQILLILAVALVGCGKKEAMPKLITDPIVEKEIRESLEKPTGELTKADLEKVTRLEFWPNELTDVKDLEKLTQLE